MNGQTLTYNDVFDEVLALEKTVASLKSKLVSLVPPKYGSDAWWEQETKKSLEDYKKGRYVSLKSKTDIDKFFANL